MNASTPPKMDNDSLLSSVSRAKTREFDRAEAKKALGKWALNKDEKLTNVFFSELASLGWVQTKQDKEDKRKKLYKLIHPERAILTLGLGSDDGILS